MKPTEILSGEHRIIEQVLDCLEKMAQKCEAEGRLDKTSAEQAVDFFRNFADRWHHGKEETYLFPAMEAKGFHAMAVPTGVILEEHEQGRAMSGAWPQRSRGLPPARARRSLNSSPMPKAISTSCENTSRRKITVFLSWPTKP